MLLYTLFPADVFQILVSMLYKMAPYNYYSGWAVTCFSIEDQLLITLMKLQLNYRDLDMSVRFATTMATVLNITNTYVSVLHEIFFDGIIKEKGIPCQIECK